MNKTVKWTKRISGFLIISLLLLCLHAGDSIPISGIKNAVTYVSKIFISHSDITFSILLLLCLIFALFDAYRYALQYMDDTQTVKNIKKEQKDQFIVLDDQCKEIESKLNSTSNYIKDSKYELREKCFAHHLKIHDCLNSLDNSYDRSLLSYHNASKRLYHIASETILHSQKAIQSLIDQYLGIH